MFRKVIGWGLMHVHLKSLIAVRVRAVPPFDPLISGSIFTKPRSDAKIWKLGTELFNIF